MVKTVYDLLAEWQISRRGGIELSVEELTIDYPELADDLRQEIAEIEDGDIFFANMFGSTVYSKGTLASEVGTIESPKDLELPGIIEGKYEIIEHINSGSFGSVWKAKSLNLNRLVAIKFPSALILHNTDKLAEFNKEAEILASFQHNNVVTIYDHGEVELLSSGTKCPYIVMELMDSSLKEHLTDWVNDPIQASKIILILSKVLESAHNHKTVLIHRDIKPNNILIKYDSNGGLQVKFADFGLATNRNIYYKDNDLKLLGAIGFVPPERLEKKPEDARSDIYSLGTIFYILITGDTSFTSTNTHTLDSMRNTERNLHVGTLPFATVNPVLSDYDDIVKICKKAREFNPDDRYNNAKELSNALEKVIEKYSVNNIHSDSFAPKHSSFKNWSVIMLIAVIVFSGFVIHGYIVKRNEPALPEPALPEPALPEPALPEPAQPEPTQPELQKSPVITRPPKEEFQSSDYVILGKNYLRGEGVVKDLSKSLSYFLKAAKLGDTEAQYYVGEAYLSGIGVKRNPQEAEKWLIKAANKNDVRAQSNLGHLYFERNDHANAIKYYTEALENGDKQAHSNLAVVYLNRKDVPKDYEKVIEHYSAILNDNSYEESTYYPAIIGLQQIYINSDYAGKDISKYIELQEKAASFEDEVYARTYYEMGYMCETGQLWEFNAFSNDNPPPPVYPINKSKALEWYLKALKYGYDKKYNEPELLARIENLKKELGVGNSISNEEKDITSTLQLGQTSNNDITNKVNSQLQQVQKQVKDISNKISESEDDAPEIQGSTQEVPSFAESNIMDAASLEDEIIPSENTGKITRPQLPDVGRDTREPFESGLSIVKLLGSISKDRKIPEDSVFMFVEMLKPRNDTSAPFALNSIIKLLETGNPSANDIAYALPFIIDAYTWGGDITKEKVRTCLHMILKKYQPNIRQSNQIDAVLNKS